MGRRDRAEPRASRWSAATVAPGCCSAAPRAGRSRRATTDGHPLMGWNNPAMSWSELERRLSGLPGADDGPVSRRREHARPSARSRRPREVTPYAELHCHSHFSFLDGASSPAELVEEAVRLGLTRWRSPTTTASTGRRCSPRRRRPTTCSTVYGAELSLGLSRPQNGVPDPEGSHLLVLARGVEGYHRLAGGDDRGAPARRREGPPGLRPRGAGRAGSRSLGGAHRLSQGCGASGAGPGRDSRRRPRRSTG